MQQIARIIDRAKELNDPGLMGIALCAQENAVQEAANVGKALASLGRLIGLINLFMGIIGGPEISDFTELSSCPLDEVIEPLDDLIKALKAARQAVPIP